MGFFLMVHIVGWIFAPFYVGNFYPLYPWAIYKVKILENRKTHSWQHESRTGLTIYGTNLILYLIDPTKATLFFAEKRTDFRISSRCSLQEKKNVNNELFEGKKLPLALAVFFLDGDAGVLVVILESSLVRSLVCLVRVFGWRILLVWILNRQRMSPWVEDKLRLVHLTCRHLCHLIWGVFSEESLPLWSLAKKPTMGGQLFLVRD